MLIDDTSKVFEILDEVKKLQGRHYYTYSWDKFMSAVRRWPKMSLKEKNTCFTEYSCYELHLFIKVRDPEYF